MHGSLQLSAHMLLLAMLLCWPRCLPRGSVPHLGAAGIPRLPAAPRPWPRGEGGGAPLHSAPDVPNWPACCLLVHWTACLELTLSIHLPACPPVPCPPDPRTRRQPAHAIRGQALGDAGCRRQRAGGGGAGCLRTARRPVFCCCHQLPFVVHSAEPPGLWLISTPLSHESHCTPLSLESQSTTIPHPFPNRSPPSARASAPSSRWTR